MNLIDNNMATQLQSYQSDFGRGLGQWHRIGAGDPDMLFMAANGMAVPTYDFFFKRLIPDHSIISLDSRGAWPQHPKVPQAETSESTPAKNHNWHQHAEDLLAFANAQKLSQLNGVAHSIGAAVSVLAAIKQPDLYKSLILFEPATLDSVKLEKMMQLVPRSLKNHHKLIRGTAARRTTWPDRKTFIDSIRTKGAYREFSDEALDDYARGGLIEDGDEYKLRYDRAWEAQNFGNIVCLWEHLPKLQMPTLLVRGEHTYLIGDETYQKQKKLHAELDDSQVEFLQMDDISHMAIQQAPDQATEIVNNWIEQH